MARKAGRGKKAAEAYRHGETRKDIPEAALIKFVRKVKEEEAVPLSQVGEFSDGLGRNGGIRITVRRESPRLITAGKLAEWY